MGHFEALGVGVETRLKFVLAAGVPFYLAGVGFFYIIIVDFWFGPKNLECQGIKRILFPAVHQFQILYNR